MLKRLITLVLISVSYFTFAGNFTPGNIVVLRVGTGGAALSNASTAIFLDEYTTTGTLVQSIAVPATPSGNNHCLTLSGKATTEGALTLSPNNQYLTFVGFDTTTGYANVSTGITNRTVARVGNDGTVNTSTGFLAGSAYVTDNFRSAVTMDGSSFWCAGNGSGSSGGTWNVPFGSFTAAATQVSTAISSTRVINIYNGQLYFTANSANTPVPGLFSLGTGTPTTTGQTSTILPGTAGADSVPSPYAFFFCHQGPGSGDNVVYICDDETTSPLGGIYKFSLVNGSWVSNGNIPNANGLRGMAASATCSSVSMFLTGSTGLLAFKDTTGYNQTIAGSFTLLVTAPINTAFRGVAFTPGTSPWTAINASATPTNITCNGLANGQVATAVTGGAAPYSFTWSNAGTSQNINNLNASSYTVTVTDAAGCTASASASVIQPSALTATPTVSNVSCNGGSNGSVNLAVSGGTSTYNYDWSNGSTTQNLSGVVSGAYSVTVTDSHSCTASASSNVSQPNAIIISPTVTNLPCTGGANTGAVNISVTGGAGGYTYAWSNLATTQNISGLNTGTFSVVVTDAAHCSATQSAIVSQAGSMSLSTVIAEVKCFGESNGGITVTASGGTPTYNYAWSTGINNQPQTGLAAGSFTVTVTDQGGCTLINSITVSQPALLIATASVTDINCFGAGNGAINLNISGGTHPDKFSWSNSSTSQSLSNLMTGVYTVTVTDSNSCTATTSGTVTQPDSITINGTVTNATSFGASDGAIVLGVSGGTASYSYSWNSGSGANNSGLTAGSYCVTVTDAHSCTSSDCFTVTQPNGINEIGLTKTFIAYTSGDKLIVNSDLAMAQTCNVQIHDITGRLVFGSNPEWVSQIEMQIPLNGISSGCYIVTIAAEQAAVSQKIIIIH